MIIVMAGSGVMTIFVHKGLARNSVIGNTPVWVFPNIYRQEQIRDIKVGTSVSNEKLLNPAKYQCENFYLITFTELFRETQQKG